MWKVTNEKSLVKVDNGFFSKVKRFWFNVFSKKRNKKKKNEEYKEIEMVIEEMHKEETISKGNRLFNYDAEDNTSNNVNSEDIDENKNINSENNYSENISVNNEVMYDTVEVKNDEDDMEITFLFEKKPPKSALEEREELERKLMNYYASIKDKI